MTVTQPRNKVERIMSEDHFEQQSQGGSLYWISLVLIVFGLKCCFLFNFEEKVDKVV